MRLCHNLLKVMRQKCVSGWDILTGVKKIPRIPCKRVRGDLTCAGKGDSPATLGNSDRFLKMC